MLREAGRTAFVNSDMIMCRKRSVSESRCWCKVGQKIGQKLWFKL